TRRSRCTHEGDHRPAAPEFARFTKRSNRGRVSGVTGLERAARREHLILGTNAPVENGEIGEAKSQRQSPGMKRTEQGRYLERHDKIVRVTNEAVGPAADKRRPRQGQNSCRPILPQRRNDPDPGQLQQCEEPQQEQVWWAVAWHEEPERSNPEDM